jgi:hypothetical protein
MFLCLLCLQFPEVFKSKRSLIFFFHMKLHHTQFCSTFTLSYYPRCGSHLWCILQSNVDVWQWYHKVGADIVFISAGFVCVVVSFLFHGSILISRASESTMGKRLNTEIVFINLLLKGIFFFKSSGTPLQRVPSEKSPAYIT